MSIANWVTIISAIVMILLIMVQTRGASLGAGLGTGGEVNIVRRGSDRTVFQLTIIVAIVFCASLMVNIL